MTPSDQPSSPDTVENRATPVPLKIATRESPLAMWQAQHVASLIGQFDQPPQIVSMVSGGDVDMRPIDGKRSVGVFTKRIQQALLEYEGDVAVHSMKDLPTEKHPKLTMAASPERETVSDCLVSPSGGDLDTLPKSARIGTGSRRRAAQLLRLRPDLKLLPIRGNVQTRLKKMRDGEFDAIVLASAGLLRLKMDDLPRCELSLDTMLPAPGQGALAIEVRSDDQRALDVIAKINHPASAACTHAERTLLSELHGGCLAPIAAHATIADNRITLTARVLSLDGAECLEAIDRQPIDDDPDHWTEHAATLGRRVSQTLVDQGARPLIEAGR